MAELRTQPTSTGVSSMPPLDPDIEALLRQWIEKADADLEVAQRIAAEAADNGRIREIVGFHCQQAAEKYLKALLTRYQIEFPQKPTISRRCFSFSAARAVRSRIP